MRQSLMTIIPLADENVIPKPDDLPEDEFTNWNNISVQLCYMVDEAVETGMAAKKAPKGNRKGEMTQWWSNHCMSNCFSLATIYTLLAHFTSTYDFSDKSLLEKVSHIIWARGQPYEKTEDVWVTKFGAIQDIACKIREVANEFGRLEQMNTQANVDMAAVQFRVRDEHDDIERQLSYAE